MAMSLTLVTFLAPDYDKAIGWFCGALGFALREDADLGAGKRWVVVASPGDRGARVLIARPGDARQSARVGDQLGGRVGFFLHSDDFAADHANMRANGVHFLEPPRFEAYGIVAQFEDFLGNRWDLIQPAAGISADAGR